ncbi:MAG: cbb3-type cytochrome oxidase assembly protein CcoS [Ignavibacteria bacterium]|nr:cbb3-type cytochrome oxidase assembly protein CcoS [Ignavibacteria bacterium]
MSVIFVLIGASLAIAVGFLIAYIWAVKSGQYDDKYTPSIRILFDNQKKQNETESKSDLNNKQGAA